MDGAELKKAREKLLKLTQSELAEAIGMKRNSIARMERGERPVLRHTELAIKYLLLTMSKKSRRKK
jgi:transcriptional regulator with XRE-family HTH domain